MGYNTIYEGQRVRIQVTYRLNGVLTNPTIAQVFIKAPSGSTSTLTYPDTNFVQISTGTYEVYHTFDAGGTWWVRAEGAGVIDGVEEYPIIVESSAF